MTALSVKRDAIIEGEKMLKKDLTISLFVAALIVTMAVSCGKCYQFETMVAKSALSNNKRNTDQNIKMPNRTML
jgi:aerobic-type carbon monoxide dehydrogenase small subunit (CoxS/CutS family)